MTNWINFSIVLCFIVSFKCLSLIFKTHFTVNFLEPLKNLSPQRVKVRGVHAKFSLRKPALPDDDMCYIVPGKEESLGKCSFNTTAKTFLVIHGWTVSGLFESWVAKLVAALYSREKDANVIVVDWLNTAQNHYALAAQSTQKVGQEVAHFIDWIEEMTNIPLDKLHLIGYNLGAHVAGFAGSYANNKVGRITGLDPAGPDFEGVHAHQRLSPDDAVFVDVLHTFSRGSLGLSIGIEQPVGHVDIYPNGGSFQPGCNLQGALKKVANLGLLGEDPVCEHERSVHLFIDSLLNEEEASKAYRCASSDMFNRGMCLKCRKDRCNTVGYDARRIRRARSIKMFTKTRAAMPFRGLHCRSNSEACRLAMVRFLLVSFIENSLLGDPLDIYLLKSTILSLSCLCVFFVLFFFSRKGKITPNKTHSFLLVTEEDIGDLQMMKMRMEDSSRRPVSSLISTAWSWWNGDSSCSEIKAKKISIRTGETQKNAAGREAGRTDSTDWDKHLFTFNMKH
uniref:Lipase domain-containing protein n=1 Tax=Electrophorus electricus TaxID=8005 RepID=A0A4W4GAZ5_ELEEL